MLRLSALSCHLTVVQPHSLCTLTTAVEAVAPLKGGTAGGWKSKERNARKSAVRQNCCARPAHSHRSWLQTLDAALPFPHASHISIQALHQHASMAGSG